MKPFFHLQSKVKYCGILMNKACPEITDNMASYVNGEKYFFNEKNTFFASESNFDVKLWKEKFFLCCVCLKRTSKQNIKKYFLFGREMNYIICV
jgi:hypothetical protein